MAIVQQAALPQMLDVRATADWLGISRATLYRLFQRRELRRVTVGRAVRVPRAEVEAYIARKLEECA